MIEVNVVRPIEVSPFGWLSYQNIARAAYSEALSETRSQEEIDYLVRWGQPDKFQDVRINPNTAVGDRLFKHQSYSGGKIVVATMDGANPVGYGYIANNVSGNIAERTIKRLGYNKKYVWIGEIVVKPDSFRLGVAKEIGKKLLNTANPNQPVSAFIWPEENPGVEIALSNHGFKPVGEQQVNIFGPDSRPVTQLMMKADSVNTVLRMAN
jgi:hypothetical protein